MNRAEKFQKIFNSRHESANKASAAIEKLTNVKSALESCQSLLKTIAAQLRDSPDDDRKATAVDLQDKIDRNFLKKVNVVLQEMTEIETRFKRKKINIGITGNAGIGKSTLLQNLTGLPGDIIPARDPNNPMGGSCTGAPSVIQNNTDDERTYAEVEFYQEIEFFEDIILPYYEAINKRAHALELDEWTRHPVSFDDFMNNPLPELPSELEQDVGARNLFKALKDRHEHANRYSRDFGRIIRNLERPSDIRRFVAQKDANNNDNFEWIPVKMVRIFCPFKNANGERNMDPFSVCDTPGLGDIGCKADDNLASNIAENVDAVWMMNLVTSNAQIVKQSDSDLYSIFREALPEWQPQQWVYGVINRYTGVTPEQIQAYRTEMHKRHIEVRKIFELDARNVGNVLESFDATLDDIVENQSVLDEILFKSRNDKSGQVIESIRNFAEKELKLFLEEYKTGMMDANTAKYKFSKEVWKLLRGGLTELRKRYEKKANDNNETLERCVRELSNQKDNPDFLVKPVKDIAIEIKADATDWFIKELNRLRVALGKEIGKTGTSLAFLFDDLRNEVREIFVNAGLLGNILPAQASNSDVEWLTELATRMRAVPTPQKDILEDIAQGIETFQKATLSYEQLLEPRITQYRCLDCLNPNKPEGHEALSQFDSDLAVEENVEATNDADRYVGAGHVRKALTGLIQHALEKVCKRLNEKINVDGVPSCILIEPSAALYSAIEKFYLVTFADEDSKEKWEDFYTCYRDEIWSDDRQRIPLSIIRQWTVNVDKLISALNNN